MTGFINRKCLCFHACVFTCLMHKGTALVRPEPVDNVRDDFRGTEFHCGKSGNLRRVFSRRRGGELS